MKPISRHLLAAACASLLFAGTARAETVQAVRCDRMCLDAMMDRYLDAMLEHNPTKVPLSPDVRITENTFEIKPGEGLWGTLTGLTDYRIHAADPVTGNAGFMGRVMENGYPRYFAVRIKVDGGKITEIESVVARNIKMPMDVDVKVPRAPLTQVLPAAQRSSRLQMVAALNGYADALVESDGKLAPFSDQCVRRENGMQTTSAPLLLPATPRGLDIAGMNCRDQISSRIFADITSVGRRIWVVDEERGIILGQLMFNSDGRDRGEKLSNGEDIPLLGEPAPSSGPIAEAFRVVNGRIHEIEAVFGAGLSYGASSGW